MSVKADDKSKMYDGAVFSPFTAAISGFVAGETEAGPAQLRCAGGDGCFLRRRDDGRECERDAIRHYADGRHADRDQLHVCIRQREPDDQSESGVGDAERGEQDLRDADPAFTGTLTGFLAGRRRDGDLQPHGGRDGRGRPYAISAVLGPVGVLSNYDITYNTASFTITKKTASVTPNAASKTYGDADPALTGTLTGFLAADSVTATYSRTAGETVRRPYTISATLSPVGVLSNYDITYNTASFTIASEGGVGDAERGEQDLRRRRTRRSPAR